MTMGRIRVFERKRQVYGWRQREERRRRGAKTGPTLNSSSLLMVLELVNLGRAGPPPLCVGARRALTTGVLFA